MGAVLDKLYVEGFMQKKGDVELQGKQFFIDSQCSDVLCFPPEHRSYLEGHSLVKEGCLVIQV